jgi:sensor histidine kinase YesM
MELEKRRLENKFVYSISVAADLNLREYYLPPMILQPYIENAILHGIGNREDEKGSIGIKIEYDQDDLICIVVDNGVGRKLAGEYKRLNGIQYRSLGMALTSKRIDMLNATGNPPILVNIEDLEDEDDKPAGTRVTLRFPLSELLV